jgi:hypothetical protein
LNLPIIGSAAFAACLPVPIAKVDDLFTALEASPLVEWKDCAPEFREGWRKVKEEFEKHCATCNDEDGKPNHDPSYQFVMFSVAATQGDSAEFGCGIADDFETVESVMQRSLWDFHQKHPSADLIMVLDLLDYSLMRGVRDAAALQRCRWAALRFAANAEAQRKLHAH